MQIKRKVGTQMPEKGGGNRARSEPMGMAYSKCQTWNRPLFETRVISLGERVGFVSPVRVNRKAEHKICILTLLAGAEQKDNSRFPEMLLST
jgi:hypothetical protein